MQVGIISFRKLFSRTIESASKSISLHKTIRLHKTMFSNNFQVLTIVKSPLTSDETRSFPALAQTIVLCAPLTAGPWSAVTIKHISKNLQTYGGKQRWNHKSDTTPPIPTFFVRTSEIGIPAYNNSCPRSSQIEVMNEAGLRIKPTMRKEKENIKSNERDRFQNYRSRTFLFHLPSSRAQL